MKVTGAEPGCLVFYLNQTGKAIHVETIWRNPLLAVGASGGGSQTTSRERAIIDNAFVKVRPWQSRSGPYAFLDPFRELEVPLGTGGD